MLTYAFPTHYQLVYINFDISSFSLISYVKTCIIMHAENGIKAIKDQRDEFYATYDV